MGVKGISAAVALAMIAVLAGLILREPPVEGATNPIQLRIIHFLARVAQSYIPKVASSLGWGTYLEWRRLPCENTGGNWTAPGVKMEDTVLDGVPVRLYYPPGAETSETLLPGVVYYHGGGWVICHLDSHISTVSRISRDLGAIVVAVGYRRAPEHSYSELFDDNYKVTRMFLEKAKDFGVDPKRIALAGDSAGGQLTLSVALKVRDQGVQPAPKLLVSIYPVTQALDLALPSYQQNWDGPWLTTESMAWFFANVLLGSDSKMDVFLRNGHVPRDVRARLAAGVLNHDNVPQDMRYAPYKPSAGHVGDDVTVDEAVWEAIQDTILDPYFCPLLAEDLNGLPETILYTGKLDVLRDDGILMAQRLREDGVPVLHIMDPLGWHPVFAFFREDPDAESATATIITAAKARL